ncbi:MAG: SDR family NAD(P)-dependent oxidoreductase, partial [Planctomycetes bacterium]|nr:SDR family NAD(P)-dependent oxidoreductase [Planctomycetota bacterium]
EDSGEIQYEVYTESDNEDDAIVHSQGVAEFKEKEEMPPLNIQDLLSHMNQGTLSAENSYQAFKEMGIDYGKGHRGIQKIYQGENQVLARISLPYSVQDTKNEYVLHPGLMDSAIQSYIGLRLNNGVLPNGSEVPPGIGRWPSSISRWSLGTSKSPRGTNKSTLRPSLPFALESLEILSSCTPDMYAWVRYSDGSSVSDKVQKLDIDLCDGQGIVCVKMRGLDLFSSIKHAKHLPTTTLIPETIETSWNGMAYLPKWEEASFITEKVTTIHRAVLVVCHEDSHQFEKTIRDYYKRSKTPKVIVIRLADQTKQVSDHEWFCDIQDRAGFETCLEKIDNIDCLYFLSMDQRRSGSLSMKELIDSQEKSEIQILRLVKCLKESKKIDSTLDSYFLTLNNYSINHQPTQPKGAGIHGLAYSLAQGNHRFGVRNIDLSSEDLRSSQSQTDLLSLIVHEPASNRGDAIKLQSGKRYRQTFYTLNWDATTLSGIRQEGVYLIVGGSGTVGQVITRNLIKKYQATVIWIGRSSGDSQKIETTREKFREFGEKVVYVQADVTDLDSLKQAVQSLKERYSGIHGAIFCALVFNPENSIEQTTETEFRDILDVKTRGSLVFYTVLAKESLDFICYFSSGQAFSFSGASRYSAYASGITFSDSLIQSLKDVSSFPVGTINWGFWKSSMEKGLRVQNVDFIEDQNGFECFEQFINILERGRINQVICLKASPAVQSLMNCNQEESIRIAKRATFQPTKSFENHIEVPQEEISSLDSTRWNEFEERLTELLFCHLDRLMQSAPQGVSQTVSNLQRQYGILDKYTGWWHEYLNILSTKKYLTIKEGVIGDYKTINTEAILRDWQLEKERYCQDPEYKAQVNLVNDCLENLPEILQGRILATDIIFPNSSVEKVEGVYKNNATADYYNEVLANAVVSYLQQRIQLDSKTDLRILEIGAGTGGTSEIVFTKLKPFRNSIDEYCYTDISKAFLLHAEEKYGRENPYIVYQLFDIEQPLEAQGIKIGTYDLVIATNVLHATKNIRQTLRNAKAALHQDGYIFLNEMSNNSLFARLTFGLLDGWWLAEDPELRITNCPGLYPETWREVLEEEGFSSVLFPAEAAHSLGQQTIIARSDGIIRQKICSRDTHLPRPSLPQEPRKNKKQAQESSSVSVTLQNVKEYIETTIRDCLSSSLKVAQETIDRDVTFSEYGLDSILGVNFIDQVNDRLSITMNTAIVFEYSSPERLTNYVLTTYKKQIEAQIRDQMDQNVTSNDENQTLLLEKSHRIKAAVSHKRHLFSRRGYSKNIQNERTRSQVTEIAVIGISGQFPKAKSVNAFWKNLIEGVDGVEELPSNYLVEKDNSQGERESGKSDCKWGGILEERDCFDPLFFNISPREAESMNPHQRLVLQEGWKAIEDAGYNPKTLSGSNTGVFIGAEPTGYFHESFTGSSEAIIASRLSYFLNLNGPAFVINTGCSSSGVALHQACESLRNRESDLVLAGGVNACMGQNTLMLLSEIEMLSPSGRCFTFDEAGDGTIISEGIGMVVLKRLEDAVASGDPIYGVISGSGINQDGASNGITAPSGTSQERLITGVYEKYQINPEEIGYIEAHGTGTKLGDPVEANALVRAFQRHTRKQGYCAVGSAKSHIGHTAAAAGVIGLIKVLLSMQHKQIPALLHFKKLNSLIEFKESPFFINTHMSQWESKEDSPRMAALSSFGHSGTNAHLVIKEYIPIPSIQTPVGMGRDTLSTLIPFSAKREESLKASIEEFLLFLNYQETVVIGKKITLEEIAYTLQTGREPMRYRTVFLAENISGLKKQLDSFLKEEKGIKDCLKGKAEPNQTSLLSSDEDAQEMLVRWVEKGKLKKIGELWCQGFPIEWELLYGENRPGRIHLPTYSFAKERYWRAEEKGIVKKSEGSEYQQLNPLLHQNTSTLEEERFTSTFTGHEFFLNDHQVKGEKVLPGVCYLEMARAAVEKGSGERVEGSTIHLKHVVWSQPIVVDGSTQKVHIGLYGEDDGRIQYEVYTESDNEEGAIVHSQGIAQFKVKEGTTHIDIEDLQSHMNRGTLSADSCYQTFKEMGMKFGEGHRGIREIYLGENQVLARLSLPSSVQDTQSEYVLHPSLMDSALQSSIGLILKNGALANGSEAQPDINKWPSSIGRWTLRPSLPFALESLEILGSCTSEMYTWVRYSCNNESPDKVQKLDIELCDEQGNICVKMRGLETKETTDNFNHSKLPTCLSLDKIPEEEAQLVCFEEVWQKEKNLGVTDKREKTLICFLSNSGLQKEFLDSIRCTSPETQIIFISQGNEVQKSSSQQHYSIVPSEKESYLQVLRKIAETTKNIDAIVYLWPIEDAQLIQEMGPIVWVLQSLKTSNVKVTDLLLAGEAHNPREQSFLESWIGFERSLGMVLPQTKVRVLIGSAKPSIRGIKDWAKRIWDELHTADTKSVWYQHRQRFVPHVRRLRLNAKKPLLKSQGTYLITGGLGGLGLLFAEHLVITYKANLILTGRTLRSKEKRNSIDVLQQQGGKVVYLQADIS